MEGPDTEKTYTIDRPPHNESLYTRDGNQDNYIFNLVSLFCAYYCQVISRVMSDIIHWVINHSIKENKEGGNPFVDLGSISIFTEISLISKKHYEFITDKIREEMGSYCDDYLVITQATAEDGTPIRLYNTFYLSRLMNSMGECGGGRVLSLLWNNRVFYAFSLYINREKHPITKLFFRAIDFFTLDVIVPPAEIVNKREMIEKNFYQFVESLQNFYHHHEWRPTWDWKSTDITPKYTNIVTVCEAYVKYMSYSLRKKNIIYGNFKKIGFSHSLGNLLAAIHGHCHKNKIDDYLIHRVLLVELNTSDFYWFIHDIADKKYDEVHSLFRLYMENLDNRSEIVVILRTRFTDFFSNHGVVNLTDKYHILCYYLSILLPTLHRTDTYQSLVVECLVDYLSTADGRYNYDSLDVLDNLVGDIDNYRLLSDNENIKKKMGLYEKRVDELEKKQDKSSSIKITSPDSYPFPGVSSRLLLFPEKDSHRDELSRISRMDIEDFCLYMTKSESHKLPIEELEKIFIGHLFRGLVKSITPSNIEDDDDDDDDLNVAIKKLHIIINMIQTFIRRIASKYYIIMRPDIMTLFNDHAERMLQYILQSIKNGILICPYCYNTYDVCLSSMAGIGETILLTENNYKLMTKINKKYTILSHSNPTHDNPQIIRDCNNNNNTLPGNLVFDSSPAFIPLKNNNLEKDVSEAYRDGDMGHAMKKEKDALARKLQNNLSDNTSNKDIEDDEDSLPELLPIGGGGEEEENGKFQFTFVTDAPYSFL